MLKEGWVSIFSVVSIIITPLFPEILGRGRDQRLRYCILYGKHLYSTRTKQSWKASNYIIIDCVTDHGLSEYGGVLEAEHLQHLGLAAALQHHLRDAAAHRYRLQRLTILFNLVSELFHTSHCARTLNLLKGILFNIVRVNRFTAVSLWRLKTMSWCDSVKFWLTWQHLITWGILMINKIAVSNINFNTLRATEVASTIVQVKKKKLTANWKKLNSLHKTWHPVHISSHTQFHNFWTLYLIIEIRAM